MNHDPEDLWPDLAELSVIRAPVDVLREQASALSQKTHNRLRAHVKTDAYGETFVHRFNLLVPRLDDYTYELFSVSHDLKLYPVTCSFQAEHSRADSESDLIAWLRKVLTSEQTKQILAALLAQARN